MTEQEKKMKAYVNAVERRLRLPRDVRNRVMNDFQSSIAARREAGKTDEDIYRELGTPKEAARELNEQMKAFAYRKSPWRFAFLALAVLSGGCLLIQGLLQLSLYWAFQTHAATVGIIGGADGPTSVFVTAQVGFDWDWLIPALLLIAGILGYWRACRRRPK